ncbi:MAG TPA: hemerythrin domain-containing protein [Terriglobales bacterium]|nr:hemerythrin domain-containing protein [Terriglobales bacterium]
MPVQIGVTSSSFADPINLLSDCHRRIEMFLGVLQAVGDNAENLLTEENRKSLETALRYFREAAPKHTADEEESLFPRLRQLRNSAVHSALQQLDLLEADHRDVAPLHVVVDKLGERYLQTGALTHSEAVEFREAVAKLISSYSQHIATEDGVVFPMAAKLLPTEDRKAVAQEMAARRNVRPA